MDSPREVGITQAGGTYEKTLPMLKLKGQQELNASLIRSGLSICGRPGCGFTSHPKVSTRKIQVTILFLDPVHNWDQIIT